MKKISKKSVFLAELTACIILINLSANTYCSQNRKTVNQLQGKGYTLNRLTDSRGHLIIAWIFSKAGENRCEPFLVNRLKSSDRITFASYKPTLSSAVRILESGKTSAGFFDGTYCRGCRFSDSSIKPVILSSDPGSRRRPRFVMHHKIAVLEKNGRPDRVITGSFNWNRYSALYNYDDMIETESSRTVSAFKKELKNMASQYNPVPSVTHDGSIHTAFNQACHKLLIPYIKNSRKSIHAAIYLLRPPEPGRPNYIYDELVKARKRGVAVNIIADGKEADRHNFDKLPVIKARLKRGFFHHKFMIIDEQTVATGSFNYVYKAMHGNNETLVVIEEPLMAKSYLSHWQQLYKKFKSRNSQQ